MKHLYFFRKPDIEDDIRILNDTQVATKFDKFTLEHPILTSFFAIALIFATGDYAIPVKFSILCMCKGWELLDIVEIQHDANRL
jgi:hypothetical protein